MAEARLIETGTIDPSAVDATRRIRRVTEAGVSAVIASYEELHVIKDPIDLRRVKGESRPRLMAGGHRLEAARRIGIEVPYKLWDCTNDWAELCELDDNLAGADLNPLDTAVFLARRKAVYEKLHPDTKKRTGAPLAAARWNATDIMSVASFATTTAEKFGLTERHVRRLISAGARLTIDEVEMLRRAPIAVSLNDLAQISKIGADEERAFVVEELASGRTKKAAEARKAWKVREQGFELPIQDPVERQFGAIDAAWARASMAAQRRFVDQHATILAQLLREVRK